MVVETDSERVKHSRKMVLEFLGSGVDLDQAPELQKWMDHYGSDTSRYDQYELRRCAWVKRRRSRTTSTSAITTAACLLQVRRGVRR